MSKTIKVFQSERSDGGIKCTFYDPASGTAVQVKTYKTWAAAKAAWTRYSKQISIRRKAV